MTTTETVTPPECCPICGDAIEYEIPAGPNFAPYTRHFKCGAEWLGRHPQYADGDPWWTPCKHAFAAALRCGATLHPTAKETATAALVEACVAEHNAVLDTDAFNGNQLTDLYALRVARADAISARVLAVYAYLAAQEPRP